MRDLLQRIDSLTESLAQADEHDITALVQAHAECGTISESLQHLAKSLDAAHRRAGRLSSLLQQLILDDVDDTTVAMKQIYDTASQIERTVQSVATDDPRAQ
jgi:methyl-accepting chemotaxis protein